MILLTLAENMDQIRQQQQQQHHQQHPSSIIKIDLDGFFGVVDNTTTTTPLSTAEEDAIITTDEDTEKFHVPKNPAAEAKNFPQKRYVSLFFSLLFCVYYIYILYAFITSTNSN